jgi:hypothetical protein
LYRGHTEGCPEVRDGASVTSKTSIKESHFDEGVGRIVTRGLGPESGHSTPVREVPFALHHPFQATKSCGQSVQYLLDAGIAIQSARLRRHFTEPDVPFMFDA